MDTITLQTIKTKGAKAISDDHPTWLIVNSKPKVVMVPPQDYEMLMEAVETLEDIQVYEERKHEKGIPLEEFFKKYFPNDRRGSGVRSGISKSTGKKSKRR